MPGNKAGIAGTEKRNRTRHFLRTRVALQWRLGSPLSGFVFRKHPVDQGRFHCSRCNHIHTDIEGGQIDGHRPAKTDNAGLRRAVCRAAGIARDSRDTGDIDNGSSSAFLHHSCGSLPHDESPSQVHRQHAIECFERSLEEGSISADSGGVDHAIQPAMTRHDGMDHQLHACRILDVDVERHDLAGTGRLNRRPVRDDDRSAFFSHAFCDRCSDTGQASGHHSDLSL
jgi:hypothetical protein